MKFKTKMISELDDKFTLITEQEFDSVEEVDLTAHKKIEAKIMDELKTGKGHFAFKSVESEEKEEEKKEDFSQNFSVSRGLGL